MAGTRGKSGPPGNQNAFRHGLAAVHQRRNNGELTQDERDVRAVILDGLLADKGGEAQISTGNTCRRSDLCVVRASTEAKPRISVRSPMIETLAG